MAATRQDTVISYSLMAVSTEPLITFHELKAQREAILGLAEQYGARNVRVFGWMVRGEADAASDVDFLVELERGRSLLDLGGLADGPAGASELQSRRDDPGHVEAARPGAGAARGEASVRSDVERLRDILDAIDQIRK